MWVTDFAQGIHWLAVSHCAMCIFNKVSPTLQTEKELCRQEWRRFTYIAHSGTGWFAATTFDGEF